MLEREFDEECWSLLSNTPFIFEHEGSLIFEIYNYRDMSCINIFTTLVSGIDVIVYGLSSLLYEDDEE